MVYLTNNAVIIIIIIIIKEPPSIKEVEKFWKKSGAMKKNNEETEWIKREEERRKETEQQEWEDIELKEKEFSLRKPRKWKSPGLDKLNILTSTHKVLTHTLSQTMKNPEEIPEWLAKGITYLLPKVSETNNPKNYRLITCLSTTYKLLTSIMTFTHIHSYNIKNCYHTNRKDAEGDHTDAKTSYLLTE